MVMCAKLHQRLPGLDSPPWPGEIGQRIYENISAQAWKQWEDRQKMVLNEYRLTPVDPKARQFLVEEMEKFLFGAGSQAPEGFVEPGA